MFFGVLDDQGQPVITNPETATVTIVDDIDRKFTTTNNSYVHNIILTMCQQQSLSDLNERNTM